MIPKFRAWEISGKRMISVKSIDFVNRFIEYIHRPYSNPNRILSEILEFENIILMQSTGLKDKNGVEIFEGDIVTYRGEQYTVSKNGGALGLSFVKKQNMTSFKPLVVDFVNLDRLVVVANIYENQELVEG